ncbi:hypothetical protein O9K51_08318 [Purpureocillium lavendulum]|uniref:Uncharacterized protein n=1 Tax=Purpureocillium lavendulum TaxID=1247861 RepID=A0AB34FJ92_9HYPO|nr:hypothetical protein O9K51_08318 [Purpureocillium lavendulum]
MFNMDNNGRGGFAQETDNELGREFEVLDRIDAELAAIQQDLENRMREDARNIENVAELQRQSAAHRELLESLQRQQGQRSQGTAEQPLQMVDSAEFRIDETTGNMRLVNTSPGGGPQQNFMAPMELFGGHGIAATGSTDAQMLQVVRALGLADGELYEIHLWRRDGPPITDEGPRPDVNTSTTETPTDGEARNESSDANADTNAAENAGENQSEFDGVDDEMAQLLAL